MTVAQGSKPVKKASAPKKSKAAPSHPPYIDMIKEALVSLKERTGSSTYAIAKHIEEKQKVGDLLPNFRKLLAIQIKKFVASGKLVKVKNSFKLPPASTNATAKTTTTKPKPKAKETAPKKKTTTSKPKAAAVKKVMKSPVKKVAVVKAKKPKSIKSPVKKSPVAKKAKK